MAESHRQTATQELTMVVTAVGSAEKKSCPGLRYTLAISGISVEGKSVVIRLLSPQSPRWSRTFARSKVASMGFVT